MVQALVELSHNSNRVLNIIKAKFDLKDKSAAIEYLVGDYIENVNEPELRPEFIEKMKKIQREPSIEIKDFEKHFGLKNV